MEFLVAFDVTVSAGVAAAEVQERVSAEATAAAGLARDGRLVRLWRPPPENLAIGLYRADSEAELDSLVSALPLAGWMRVTVTRLEPHPNDPASSRPSAFRLPDPRLRPVYRLDATLGEPVDVGDTGHGQRRVVPLTGGTFTGPPLNGELLRRASASGVVDETYLVQ